MARVVRFYERDRETVEMGKLSWNGIAWQATGDPFVRGVLDERVFSQRTHRTVTSKDDPEEFLDAVARKYNSPYLWADFPTDE